MLHCSFGIGNNHYNFFFITAAHDGSDEKRLPIHQYAHTYDYTTIYDTNMQSLSLHRQLRSHQLSLQCCMFQ